MQLAELPQLTLSHSQSQLPEPQPHFAWSVTHVTKCKQVEIKIKMLIHSGHTQKLLDSLSRDGKSAWSSEPTQNGLWST